MCAKICPRLLDELSTQYPQIKWVLSPAAGETELLIQALADSALALSKGQATLLEG